MAKKILDEYVLDILPQASKNDVEKLENQFTDAVAAGTSSGLEDGAKTGTTRLKSFFKKNWGKAVGAALVAGVGAAVQIAERKADAALTNVRAQLVEADRLGTAAQQLGIPLKDFLKLQKTLEFADVDPQSATDALVEFTKKLGDFQKFGAQAEVFAPLGITREMGAEEAFYRTASALQNMQGAQRAVVADKIFGGLGTAQLAEFFTGQLGQQITPLKNIDFNKLAAQVERGGVEQGKLSAIEVEARTRKLLESDLNSELLRARVISETGRVVRDSQTENLRNLVAASETYKDATDAFASGVTTFTNWAAGFLPNANPLQQQSSDLNNISD
jgi:hypothetical protein